MATSESPLSILSCPTKDEKETIVIYIAVSSSPHVGKKSLVRLHKTETRPFQCNILSETSTSSRYVACIHCLPTKFRFDIVKSVR